MTDSPPDWLRVSGLQLRRQQLGMVGDEGVWKTLTAGTGGVDFVVEGDTGRVAVDPTSAEIHFEDHHETVSPGEDLPDRLAEFVAASPDVGPKTGR